MLSFKKYNRLDERAVATPFKRSVTAFIKSKGKKLTAGRGLPHVRFPLDGDLKDYNKFFKELDSTVMETITSISGTFDTYIVTNKQGETVYWVNNFVGINSSVQKIFNTKELTPEAMGIVGSDISSKAIIDKVTAQLKLRYSPQVVKELVYLMKMAKSKSPTIKLDHATIFNKKDMATVSKDFGEILSAIWVQSNLKFPSVYFPVASNERLIDFYGNKLHIQYPISVKSGGGGKVTIQNILDALKKRAKTANLNHDDEKSLAVFNIVRENTSKEGMLKLNQLMATKGIKSLANIMKVDYKAITMDGLKQFLSQYTNDELRTILAPLHKTLHTTLTDASWNKADKLRFVISPLGEDVWKVLNASKEIKNSLINVARQVVLLQVNIDVKTNTLNFKHNHFKDADFIFSWAGYSAGNKLGFLMKVKH